jgi:hypothetical protein
MERVLSAAIWLKRARHGFCKVLSTKPYILNTPRPQTFQIFFFAGDELGDVDPLCDLNGIPLQECIDAWGTVLFVLTIVNNIPCVVSTASSSSSKSLTLGHDIVCINNIYT